MCLSAPTRVSLSHRWRMVVTVYLLPSIGTRPSKISDEWPSLLKRNSHQEKLEALATSKHTALQFLYHSVTERKQTTLMILILYKALLVFTQNPVLLWLLRNWFLVRCSVCLFCSMTRWWILSGHTILFLLLWEWTLNCSFHSLWPPPPIFMNHLQSLLVAVISQLDLGET